MPRKSTTGSSDLTLPIGQALLRQEIQSALVSFLQNANRQALPFATRNTALQIPTSIFHDAKLGVLESLVKYLRETGYTFKEIGILLKKDNKVCWSVYKKAKEKRKNPFDDLADFIPLDVFTKRGCSCLQSAVTKLHDDYGLSYNRIADLLNRDYKTIYTTYRRAIS